MPRSTSTSPLLGRSDSLGMGGGGEARACVRPAPHPLAPAPGVTSPRVAEARASHLPPHFEHCGIPYLLDHAKHGFSFVGRPRSGKTSLITILLLSALSFMRRAFVFDYKSEYIDLLRRRVPTEMLTHIAPLNDESVRYDIAGDVNSIRDAEAVGALLAPVPPSEHQPYFSEHTQNLLKGLVVSNHILRPNAWNLSHLTKAMESTSAMRNCLAIAPELNRGRLENYLKAAKQNRDVTATLENRRSDLAAVAEHWATLREGISLTDWMTSGKILVFGHSHKNANATVAISRLLISRLAEILLDEPNCDTPQSWIFLDELPSAGRIDPLHDLLSKGPGKGVVSVLGYQDFGSLRDLYGPDRATAINSFSAFKWFGALNDPESAERASLHFGERERLRFTRSISHTYAQQSSTTVGVGEHYDRCRIVPPSRFLNIRALGGMTPSGRPVTWLAGYVISPIYGKYPYALSLKKLQRLLPREAESQGAAASVHLASANSRELPPHDSEDALPYQD